MDCPDDRAESSNVLTDLFKTGAGCLRGFRPQVAGPFSFVD